MRSNPPDDALVTPVHLSLTLPMPPSVNSQYVTAGRRRVLSKSATAFKHDVGVIVEKARREMVLTPAMERAFATSHLGLMLEFFFETPYRRDLDGGLKIALDALAEAIGFDDRTVVDVHLSKRIDPLHPRLEVDLETIPAWEFDETFVYLGESVDSVDDSAREHRGTKGDRAI